VAHVLSPLLTFAWIGAIFSFSTQTGTESAALSRGVLDLLGLDPEVFHTPVRKAAHMAMYFVLAALFVDMLMHHHIARPACYAVVLAILIATLDETVQHFIPGRVGALMDVMIDTAGAVVGATVMFTLKQHITPPLHSML